LEGSYVTSLYPVKAKTVKTQETLISYCNRYNHQLAARIGVNITLESYKRYGASFNHLRTKYNLSDISFQALDYSFVEAFDFYLRVQLKFKPNTIVGIWGNSKGSELLATPCPYREQSPSPKSGDCRNQE